jgi:hypothetical protein
LLKPIAIGACADAPGNFTPQAIEGLGRGEQLAPCGCICFHGLPMCSKKTAPLDPVRAFPSAGESLDGFRMGTPTCRKPPIAQTDKTVFVECQLPKAEFIVRQRVSLAGDGATHGTASHRKQNGGFCVFV